MPRTRMMGAGLAGSSAYRTRTHGEQGGGNKLQGLPPTTNKNVNVLRNIQIKGYGENRNVIFCVNQLGGVGAVGGGNGSRMFGTTSDGVKDCITGPYGCEQVVREAYLEAYGREPDKSGLRTYCIAMTKRRWSKDDIIADLKKNEDSLAPIYATLEGNYLMYIYDFTYEDMLPNGAKVHIDNQGNITVNPSIGKITVNSETEYSLTMDFNGVEVENAVGGPNDKIIIPARSYGNMPRINTCELYFYNDSVNVVFFKDTDGDGVDDSNDPFPENPNKNNVTQPPVITLNGDNPFNVELGSVYEDPGATATDEVGDSIPNPNFDTKNGNVDSSSIVVSGSVDTNIVGSYTITYIVYDNWGFSSSVERIVNVVDTTAPVITVTGDNPVYIELGNAYEDAGATASDLSEPVTVTSDWVENVDVNTLGSYTITYTATDFYGNSSTVTRTVNVADTTAPVITLIGNATLTVLLGSDYEESGATAFDLSGDVSDSLEITGTVDTTTEGEYTLTYTAVDESGNSATVTRTVIVIDQHPYTFQSLYNALKSDDGVDGGLIQVDTDGEFDGNKMLTKGPGVFAEMLPINGTGSFLAKKWDSRDWYSTGLYVATQPGLYGRGDQQEVSVPGIMLLDPDSISSPTVDQPLNADSLDIDDSSKLIGLSIIQTVSGGFGNGVNEVNPLFRYVWRLPEGTPSFFYKLYLRFSPNTPAGDSTNKKDYLIMNDQNNYPTYFANGVGKAEYGAKFPSDAATFDGPSATLGTPEIFGTRVGIKAYLNCNNFALVHTVENVSSTDRFYYDCDNVGWTEGEQYGTTIKVWVEIVDENGNLVQDNSYESLMASAGGEADGESGESKEEKQQKIPGEGTAPGN